MTPSSLPGNSPVSPSVGRNDRCPCGSGRKYKRCCLNKTSTTQNRPSQNTSNARLTGRFIIPDLGTLHKINFNELQSGLVPRQKLPQIRLLIRNLLETTRTPGSKTPFHFSRLTTGELNLSFSFRDPIISQAANVQFQERTPQDDLVTTCSCPEGRNDRVCEHLFASVYCLWSLIRQESPRFQDLSPLQIQFDLLLKRQPKPDPDANIQWMGLLFCPPPQAATDPQGARNQASGDTSDNDKIGTPSSAAPSNDPIAVPSMTLKHFRVLEGSRSEGSQNDSTFWNSFPHPEDTQSEVRISSAIISSYGSTPISACLEYRFSNGCSLKVQELMTSRWLKKVPSAFLPLELNGLPKHQNKTQNKTAQLPPWVRLQSSENYCRSPEHQGIERDILHCLQRALSASIPVAVVNSQHRDQERLGTIIRSIRAETPRAHWMLKPTRNFNEAEIEFSGNSHTYWQQIGDELLLLSGPRTLELGSSLQKQGPLQGQTRIQEQVQALNAQLSIADLPLVQTPLSETLNQPAIQPEIWLDGKGSASFSQEMTFSQGGALLRYRTWNITSNSNRLFGILNQGITASSPQDSKEIAHQHSGPQRNSDLKILRHTGFAAALVLETLSFCLYQTSSTGTPITDKKTFQTSIENRLVALAEKILQTEREAKETPAKISSPPQSLKDYLSKRVVTLIQDWIAEVIDAVANHHPIAVIFPENIVPIQGLIKNFARIVHAMISQAAQHSNGACFIKAKIPAILCDPEQPSFWRSTFCVAPVNPEESIQPYGQTALTFAQAKIQPILSLHASLSLIPFGFQIYWQGQPISELQPQDLQTLFDLKTSENPNSGRGTLDWFELHPQVFLMGREISHSEFAKLATEGTVQHRGRLYVIPQTQLPSLKRLASFWERLQNPSGKSEGFGQTHYRSLPRSETLEFLALSQELGSKVSSISREWQRVFEFYQSLDQPRPPLKLPSSIRADLKPYQNAGVQWLWELHQLKLGGILADDMGLGKTLQALSFLELLRQQGKLGNCLIVVPTSLTWNWISEAKRFTPELPIRTFEGKNKTSLASESHLGVLVVTYGLLLEHSDWFAEESGSPRLWNIVLFDEAQNLKNLSSRRTDAARRLVAEYKFCLTGTPLENHVGELYSLLDLVVPGCMGDPALFKNRFDQWVDPKSFQLEFTFLRKKIRPLLMRRSKKQILTELPEKTETRVNLPLEPNQKKIYRDIALSYTKQINDSILKIGEAKSQLLILTALLRLRQACSDPSCIPNVRYSKISPKLELMIESLPEIIESGQSVLIFTQFLTTLERWVKHLRELKIPVLAIHGGVSRKEREQILSEFQSPTSDTVPERGRVLIMTLKTGGVGLNLTQASYVFHVEPWWNPAAENQATDRAHRMGQTRPVQVYRYIMQDTVEEKIEVLKSQKSALFQAILNDTAVMTETIEDSSHEDFSDATRTSSGPRGLTRKDFELLLSMKA